MTIISNTHYQQRALDDNNVTKDTLCSGCGEVLEQWTSAFPYNAPVIRYDVAYGQQGHIYFHPQCASYLAHCITRDLYELKGVHEATKEFYSNHPDVREIGKLFPRHEK